MTTDIKTDLDNSIASGLFSTITTVLFSDFHVLFLVQFYLSISKSSKHDVKFIFSHVCHKTVGKYIQLKDKKKSHTKKFII